MIGCFTAQDTGINQTNWTDIKLQPRKSIQLVSTRSDINLQPNGCRIMDAICKQQHMAVIRENTHAAVIKLLLAAFKNTCMYKRAAKHVYFLQYDYSHTVAAACIILQPLGHNLIPYLVLTSCFDFPRPQPYISPCSYHVHVRSFYFTWQHPFLQPLFRIPHIFVKKQQDRQHNVTSKRHYIAVQVQRSYIMNHYVVHSRNDKGVGMAHEITSPKNQPKQQGSIGYIIISLSPK